MLVFTSSKVATKNGDPNLGKRSCGNEIIPIISCDLFIIGLIILCGTQLSSYIAIEIFGAVMGFI